LVEQRVRGKASEFGTDPDVLRTELEKGGDRQRLKDMLLAESTLDYLIEKMRVSRDECRVPREKTKYSKSAVE
jgi:hypothetical protein